MKQGYRKVEIRPFEDVASFKKGDNVKFTNSTGLRVAKDAPRVTRETSVVLSEDPVKYDTIADLLKDNADLKSTFPMAMTVAQAKDHYCASFARSMDKPVALLKF